MLRKKNYIIVGLSVCHSEFLRISIPVLAQLPQNIFLVVYNDNPAAPVEKSKIREFGHHGPLHIVNADQNRGSLWAWLGILAEISKRRIRSDWMIFADDGGLVINADIPAVQDNNFAVMQNTAFIKNRILDALRVADNPTGCAIDNSNATVQRPHLGIVGTLLRTEIMTRLGDLIRPIVPNILAIDSISGAGVPMDVVLWFYLQIYARRLNPNAKPIYMDKINYISAPLDTTRRKCEAAPAEYYDMDTQRYCDLFNDHLDANMPVGLS
jgi:hypothetical protein